MPQVTRQPSPERLKNFSKTSPKRTTRSNLRQMPAKFHPHKSERAVIVEKPVAKDKRQSLQVINKAEIEPESETIEDNENETQSSFMSQIKREGDLGVSGNIFSLLVCSMVKQPNKISPDIQPSEKITPEVQSPNRIMPNVQKNTRDCGTDPICCLEIGPPPKIDRSPTETPSPKPDPEPHRRHEVGVDMKDIGIQAGTSQPPDQTRQCRSNSMIARNSVNRFFDYEFLASSQALIAKPDHRMSPSHSSHESANKIPQEKNPTNPPTPPNISPSETPNPEPQT